MTLIEFIGFIISIVTVAFLFFKKKWDERRRRLYPDEVAKEDEEQEKALQNFLQSLKMDMEEAEEHEAMPDQRSPPQPPLPPPVKSPPPLPLVNKRPERTERTVEDNYRLKTKIEDFKPKSEVELRQLSMGITQERYKDLGEHVVSEDLMTSQEAYSLSISEDRSRFYKLMHKLKHPRDLILYHEIFMKPKTLRPPNELDF